MIGVIAAPGDKIVLREFFELFKTPWEFYRTDSEYNVLLCCGSDEIPAERPLLTVVYSGRAVAVDRERGIEIASYARSARVVDVGVGAVPVYGESVAFRERGRDVAVAFRRDNSRMLARFGYDLVSEVRSLLSCGQPVRYAKFPSLDLHIMALRSAIRSGGVYLAEIPPAPEGYSFVACLTHDMDHPLVRMHRFDHTMLGFVYRAAVGSVVRMFRGRLAPRGVWQNWVALGKLPWVFLGLAQDFWSRLDRYQQLEQGAASTFFVIPFPDDPGKGAPRARAARYGASNVVDQLEKLTHGGCEIGLHGIDAWCDAVKGRAELDEIRRVAGRSEIGARMHWLYSDENTPAALEEAGIDYDSTVGYNETIGYRAGTGQVYKPLGANHLLELPLHIMDTALFYPCHLNLSPEEAWELVGQVVENAIELGGCVTVNWHDRSVAPERLWGDFYAEMVRQFSARGAWLATAGQAVAWFRKRRSASFEINRKSGGVQVKLAEDTDPNLPGLRFCVYNGPASRLEPMIGALV